VVMHAIDDSGAPFQRQDSVIFRAQTVAVFLNYGNSDVLAPRCRCDAELEASQQEFVSRCMYGCRMLPILNA
jgi:hypothetical protein